MTIRIGILGYGNLGKGVESAVTQNQDMELVGVFTRRSPETVKVRTPGVKALHVDELEHMRGDIDVLILCGGSATDLPVQTPQYLSLIHISPISLCYMMLQFLSRFISGVQEMLGKDGERS